MPILADGEIQKVKKSENESVGVDDLSRPQPILLKTIYHLLYPEIPLNGTVNREFELDFGNEKVFMKIENGIVKTDRKDIKDYFLKKEYIFIKEEIDNE